MKPKFCDPFDSKNETGRCCAFVKLQKMRQSQSVVQQDTSLSTENESYVGETGDDNEIVASQGLVEENKRNVTNS